MSSRELTGQQKKALRTEMMHLRREMPFAVRAAADHAIADAVLASPEYAAAKQVFAYVSMPHEVGTRELLARMLADGKTVGLPVCEMQTHTMLFYRLDSMTELVSGAYRIPVPPVSPERLLHPAADTLMLVPMLAFDGDGYRLGAGGGYYDRYLAANRVQTIGICYAACRQAQLPHDEYDRTLTCCVTEQKREDFYGRSE
ncbi:MAG TPA: 5-formyltetrahydrofolate cyclo-ligase [Ruminococcus sp.]|nr:5-formyltetrahydrofolate cyclo-ligase [Ruminococcus sp.]